MNQSELNNKINMIILKVLEIYRGLIIRPIRIIINSIFTSRVYYPPILLIINLFRIFKTSIKWKMNLGNTSIFHLRINKHSQDISRNLLITLNNIKTLMNSDKIEPVNLSLHIEDNVINVELLDIFTCCYIFPVIGDIQFNFNNHLIEKRNQHTLIENSFSYLKNNNSLETDKGVFEPIFENPLRISLLSTNTWALNLIKTYNPAQFIISLNLPEKYNSDSNEHFDTLKRFFLRTWNEMPDIHFMLLNNPFHLNKEMVNNLPNVTITKMLGFSLLEEFAIVQSSDMYLGSYDVYSTFFIGSKKPFILFGLKETDNNSCNTGKCKTTFTETKTSFQTIISDNISLDVLYEHLKKFLIESSLTKPSNHAA
jgi:hypothetical protein